MMIERLLTDNDKEMIEQWISQEPDHKENSFEFYKSPNTKTVVYEDDFGPVFAVRYASALRVDVEFSPTVGKERIREMLKTVVPNVAAKARDQKFKEIVFSSASKSLIAFCRLLGFSASPDYRRRLL